MPSYLFYYQNNITIKIYFLLFTIILIFISVNNHYMGIVI